MGIKTALLQQCLEYVNARLRTVEETIQSHRKALSSETKSSAGDKHETGRAMLQLEMEKAGQQLTSILQMKEVLSKINVTRKSSAISLGTLVETNSGRYFLSISAGEITVDSKPYFAISTASPIGKLMLGKKTGEILIWNGKEINIEKIS